MGKFRAMVAVAPLAVLLLVPALASAQVTLPTTGVDVDGTITAVGTELGAYVQTALIFFGAFVAVKIGMRYLRRVGG